MESRPIIYDALEAPATSGIIILCVGIWFYLWNKSVPYEDVGLIYSSKVFLKSLFNNIEMINDNQWWRGITSSFSHLNLLHVAFNMSSLWSCRSLEVYVCI